MLTTPFYEPTNLIIGQSNLISQAFYLDGVAITPSSVTLSIRDNTGTQIQTPTVSVGANCTATITSITGTAGWKYAIVWTVTYASKTYTLKQPAILVNWLLYPVISGSDLQAVHKELSVSPLSSINFHSFIDESWKKLKKELYQRSIKTYCLADASELREAHMALAFHYVFRSMISGIQNDRWLELSKEYKAEYESLIDELILSFDTDGDAIPDGKAPSAPVVFLKKIRGYNVI
jgi:hypothetical protein